MQKKTKEAKLMEEFKIKQNIARRLIEKQRTNIF